MTDDEHVQIPIEVFELSKRYGCYPIRHEEMLSLLAATYASRETMHDAIHELVRRIDVSDGKALSWAYRACRASRSIVPLAVLTIYQARKRKRAAAERAAD